MKVTTALKEKQELIFKPFIVPISIEISTIAELSILEEYVKNDDVQVYSEQVDRVIPMLSELIAKIFNIILSQKHLAFEKQEEIKPISNNKKELSIPVSVQTRLKNVKNYVLVNKVLNEGKIIKFKRKGFNTKTFTVGTTYFGVKAISKSNYWTGTYSEAIHVLGHNGTSLVITRYATPTLLFEELK